MRLTVRLAAVASVGVLTLVVPAQAQAADVDCASGQESVAVPPKPPVLTQLDIEQAQEVVAHEAPTGQEPVRVAVLDSGVTGAGIPVARHHTDITGKDEVTYYHGTAVAGLIAGQPRGTGRPVGIAPDAEIVDVRVYDTDDRSDEGQRVDADPLAAGLEWVAEHARELNIRVANVSLAVKDTDRLEEAVAAVREENVLLVASAGNRPRSGESFDKDFGDDGPEPGEDGAEVLFPTGYDDVVSVSSTADGSPEVDAAPYVVLNSHTTVAVPTYGAVSYALDGSPCVLDPIATSWAAAEVSGVLALLFERYPHDTDEQVLARLVDTATGTPDDPTPLTGAGVVQPVEALTRPLEPDRKGEVDRTVAVDRDTTTAVAPETTGDPLAATRDDAVWWGLIGGGILVIALLLRPVLARRR